MPVEEIALVGHSMGGLVVRSACHYGAEQQHGWPDTIRHVVCLGSPHLGADLEKGVNAASWVLARLPETRAVSSFLNARSSGTKDLRYGALLEEDWSECDPDEFLRDRCHEVPLLPARSTTSWRPARVRERSGLFSATTWYALTVRLVWVSPDRFRSSRPMG